MLIRFRSAGLVWPTVLSILGLAILVSLGTWQLQRKAWKDRLIAAVSARQDRAPIALEQARADWRTSPDDTEYTPVTVRGAFAGDVAKLYYAPHPKFGPGSDVYSPLTVGPGRVVWVNRGFLPDRMRGQAPTTTTGPIEVVGLVRAPAERGGFDPDNDVARNLWYWRDLAGMHASAFPKGGVEAEPFFIEARTVEGVAADGWPRPGASAPEIPNRHLEYAVTWYGLALTLLGVYVAFAWSRLRARVAE